MSLIPGNRAVVFGLKNNPEYDNIEVFIDDYHTFGKNSDETVFCCSSSDFPEGWELIEGKNLFSLDENDDIIVETYYLSKPVRK